MDELTFLTAAQLKADLRSYVQPRSVSTPEARFNCPERVLPSVDGRRHDPGSLISSRRLMQFR
jgi:hypothetical protein